MSMRWFVGILPYTGWILAVLTVTNSMKKEIKVAKWSTPKKYY
jgi:hypothetical protein